MIQSGVLSKEFYHDLFVHTDIAVVSAGTITGK